MNTKQTKALKAKLIAEQTKLPKQIILPKKIKPTFVQIAGREERQQCAIPVQTESLQCNFFNFKQEPGMPGFKSF